jgi:hypothetical protein
MNPFDPIEKWFSGGFAVRGQSATAKARGVRRDATRSAGTGSLPPRGGTRTTPNAPNIRAVLKGAPEVMVKITGSNKGTNGLKSHLEYISRNGALSLTDETGDEHDGRGAVRQLNDTFRAAGYPNDSGKREFLHVVFSMPAGTPAESVKNAVANMAKDEFSNRHFVMALHTDKDHTHVHVAVSTRDRFRADEPRLSPRKNDLNRWRQAFAHELREQGIDAAASPRYIRSAAQKSEKFVTRQIRKDNPQSAVYDTERAKDKHDARLIRALTAPNRAFVGPYRPPRTARAVVEQKAGLEAAIKRNQRPDNKLGEKTKLIRAEIAKAWEKVEQNLVSAGDPLAMQAHSLAARARAVPVSKSQALYDRAVSIRQNDQDSTL